MTLNKLFFISGLSHNQISNHIFCWHCEKFPKRTISTTLIVIFRVLDVISCYPADSDYEVNYRMQWQRNVLVSPLPCSNPLLHTHSHLYSHTSHILITSPIIVCPFYVIRCVVKLPLWILMAADMLPRLIPGHCLALLSGISPPSSRKSRPGRWIHNWDKQLFPLTP